MKLKFLVAASAALILTSASLSSFADENHSTLLGDPAAPSAAVRTIVIGQNTGYVNVTRGEIVKFVVGDKAFAWDFNGPSNISAIDLSVVAPSGVLDHAVKAYVARNIIDDGGA